MAEKKSPAGKPVKTRTNEEEAPFWVGVLKEHMSSVMQAHSEGMDMKLESMERRLGDRIENVETRLENVETRLENVETRLENVETGLSELASQLGLVKDAIRTHSQEISNLQRRAG